MSEANKSDEDSRLHAELKLAVIYYYYKLNSIDISFLSRYV